MTLQAQHTSQPCTPKPAHLQQLRELRVPEGDVRVLVGQRMHHIAQGAVAQGRGGGRWVGSWEARRVKLTALANCRHLDLLPCSLLPALHASPLPTHPPTHLRLLLMCCASSSCCPSAPLLPTRSLPARSMRCRQPWVRPWESLLVPSTMMVSTCGRVGCGGQGHEDVRRRKEMSKPVHLPFAAPSSTPKYSGQASTLSQNYP